MGSRLRHQVLDVGKLEGARRDAVRTAANPRFDEGYGLLVLVPLAVTDLLSFVARRVAADRRTPAFRRRR